MLTLDLKKQKFQCCKDCFWMKYAYDNDNFHLCAFIDARYHSTINNEKYKDIMRVEEWISSAYLIGNCSEYESASDIFLYDVKISL
tara:strand:- start:870 stop:1127 length:258 start_codon:yes stop_codon:yes gene_type:complete